MKLLPRLWAAVRTAGEARREARIRELEAAVRALAPYAYRDGCTTLVQASAFDRLLELVSLPPAEGRRLGEMPGNGR